MEIDGNDDTIGYDALEYFKDKVSKDVTGSPKVKRTLENDLTDDRPSKYVLISNDTVQDKPSTSSTDFKRKRNTSSDTEEQNTEEIKKLKTMVNDLACICFQLSKN